MGTASPPFRRRSPTRRTQSEDVYNEKTDPPTNFSMSSTSSGDTQVSERAVRVNPLMKLAETRQSERKTSPRRKQRNDSSGESNVADDATDNKKKGENVLYFKLAGTYSRCDFVYSPSRKCETFNSIFPDLSILIFIFRFSS